MNSTTSKLSSFLRALVLLVLVAVVVPWLLIWAANRRFGGPAPWSAMPPVGDWSASTIGDALTERLSESTIADIVIRSSLTVVWLAVIVLLVTVVAELVHMVRHAGIAMPRVRGLGPSQDLARIIAAGLLVVVPMLSSSTAIADDSPLRLPEGRAPATVEARPDNAWIDSAVPPTVAAAPAVGGNVEAAPAPERSAPASDATGSYTVRPGDSVYGIAERLAGPDQAAISALANGILDLNLGQRMVDGQMFSNAAYIDVGWVLQLPPGTPSPSSDTVTAAAHVVDEGETLWSIAEDELGDASRWPEIYEANEGRTFDDGRQLSDPDMIQPGWNLDLPTDRALTDDDAGAVSEQSEAPAVIVESDAPADAEFVDDVEQHDPPAPSQRDNAWVSTTAMQPVSADDAADGATDEAVERAADRPTDETRPDSTADRAASDGPTEPAVAAPPVTPSDRSEAGTDAEPDESAVELLTLERAAMLSAGVLTLLAVLRRRRMRQAPSNSRLPEPRPEVVRAERALRTIDAGDRFARVDIAIRAAAMPLVDQRARVLAAAVGPDGDVELWASTGCELDAPWETGAEPHRWLLPASTPIELLAPEARRVGAPCPTLVQLGTCDDGRDLYVDLEALEAIEVGGPGAAADAIVAAVAATLAASVLAEVTTLVGVGVADDAFLGHRNHRPARSVQAAFSTAADAIGSTARAERSTFDLRARVTSGETWEPAVVLAGAAAGTVTPPDNRTGLAVVSASPIHGPSSRLAPEAGSWVLRPLGVRLSPIGLSADDVAALAAVVDVAEPEPIIELDDDRTMAPQDFDESAPIGIAEPSSDEGAVPEAGEPAVAPLEHALVVRLLGPVSVESTDGREVEFERSKTKELIAWLATHRDRSTRSNARAALWELDVRDATFSNVVSEARRAMARCVEPPDGEEWLGRTMTDSLPLHPLVVSDVDLVEHALDAARLQPPAQAIETLRGALDWIRSVPFEGTSYLWPDAEGITSALVLRAITLTSGLADHCLSLGDVDGVFEATSRGLQVLPAHEEMIAVRMRAYAKVGDRAGIRHEWESYERAITADPWSDGEPSPKMLDLRRELL